MVTVRQNATGHCGDKNGAENRSGTFSPAATTACKDGQTPSGVNRRILSFLDYDVLAGQRRGRRGERRGLGWKRSTKRVSSLDESQPSSSQRGGLLRISAIILDGCHPHRTSSLYSYRTPVTSIP